LFGPDHGKIPSVIFQFLFLFVRRVMFLIDNNHSQLSEGGEDGGTSPYRNLDVSPPHPSPLVVPFSGSEAAVKKAQVVSKTILEPGKELRRQRDLGNENKGFLPLSQDLLNGTKVDLCFSTAGHTVQEKGRKPLRMDSFG
jgi:hypothetical protein